MFVGTIVLGILIVVFGAIILERLSLIQSELKWLRERFVSSRERPSIHAKGINVADEFERLAPLSYIPFAETASALKRMSADIANEFEQRVNYWQRVEKTEIETFAATNPANDKPSPLVAILKPRLRNGRLPDTK